MNWIYRPFVTMWRYLVEVFTFDPYVEQTYRDYPQVAQVPPSRPTNSRPATVTQPVETPLTPEAAVSEAEAVITQATSNNSTVTSSPVVAASVAQVIPPPPAPLPPLKDPKIYLTHEIASQMGREVLAYPDQETSWGLWGYLDLESTVIIGGILRPSQQDVVRSAGNTTLGSTNQAEALKWLIHSFKLMKESDARLEAFRLAYLFAGHSHHRMRVFEYTNEDIQAIVSAVGLNKLPVAIGPLANIVDEGYHTNKLGNRITVTHSRVVDIRFYYYSQEMLNRKIYKPRLVKPELTSQYHLPPLPKLSWHFEDPDYFNHMVSGLTILGCDIQPIIVANPLKPGQLETRFEITHPNWKADLYITTKYDFPTSDPKIEVRSKTSNYARSIKSKYVKEGNSYSFRNAYEGNDTFRQVVDKLIYFGEL